MCIYIYIHILRQKQERSCATLGTYVSVCVMCIDIIDIDMYIKIYIYQLYKIFIYLSIYLSIFLTGIYIYIMICRHV
jgi:hypothetical protein